MFIKSLIEDNNVDIVDVILRRKVVIDDDHELPDDLKTILEFCIENWELQEARRCFRTILEERIPQDQDQDE